MKRQTFLKSTLCLLMALLCNLAWAEIPQVGKEYRIKDDRSQKYLTIGSYNGNSSSGRFGTVPLLDKAEVNADQVWVLETADAAAGTYYLKSKSGYYLKCRGWNVDALNGGDKSAVSLEAPNVEYLTGLSLEGYAEGSSFCIKNGTLYFKTELIDNTTWHPYCNAQSNDGWAGRTTWTFEEVPADEFRAKATLTLAYYLEGIKVGEATAEEYPGVEYTIPAFSPFTNIASCNVGDGEATTGATITVPETAATVTVELADAFPYTKTVLTEDGQFPENTTWYVLKRNSTSGDTQTLKSDADGNLSVEKTETYSDNHLWCFVGNSLDLKIYSKVAGSTKSLSSGTDPASMKPVAEAVGWIVQRSDDEKSFAGKNPFCLERKNSNGWYLNSNNYGYWSSKDAGSTLRAVSMDEIITSAQATKTAALNELALIEEADYFCYSASAITAARTAIENAPLANLEDVKALPQTINEIKAALAATETITGAPAVGDYIQIKHRGDKKYLTGNADNANNTTNKGLATTVWYVDAGDNGNVKLKNVSTGKYIGQIRQSATVSMVEKESAANLSWTKQADFYAVFKDVSGGDYAYGHVNGGNLVGWEPNAVNTQWIVSKVNTIDLSTFSTEESPKWFSVEFKTGGHFLTDKGNGNNLVTAAAADSDEEYWMFIGDQFSGFKMKSRLGNYVYFEGNRFKTTNEVTNAATLFFVPGVTDGTWELQRSGSSKCMNQNGGTGVGVQLGEYDKNNANNPFYLNEVEIFEHFIEPVFSDANNEYWFMIRFANGNAHLASNGANDQAVTANIRNVSSQWWKFVGTAENFQLVSKDGRYVTLKNGTALNGQKGDLLHMVSEPDSKGFSIVASKHASYPKSYEIIWNGKTGNSFNQWGGAGAGKSVGVWTVGDGNNPLYIYMPSPDLLSPFDIEGIASYTPASPLTLWYKNAASNMQVSDQWMEYSLPIGNGQFGASIFGGVAREEVQFNEKTLWSGTKNDNSSEYGDYENFGSVYIQDISEVFGEGKPVKDYYRQLDLSNATASVHYKSTDGNISFTREYIASYPDKVVAMRLTASEAAKVSIKVTMAAGRPGLRAETTYADGTATFGGKLETITYNALAKVVPTGGQMTTDAEGITVTGADEVLIILGGATDYDPKNANYISGTEQLPALVADRVNAAAAKSWSTLYDAHVADHKNFFDRCNFVLDGAENMMPTDELVRAYANRSTGTESYALMLEQLYFAYGRYLEIGSSRGVDLPANLQGIWNNSSEPEWNCDIHANINVQMNYWPAEPTNLSELHMPFLNYIINMANSAEWKNLAKKKGSKRDEAWTMLTENNIFGGFGAFAQNAVINNAWYVSHLWQHYRYTLDEEFLAKAFPAMWGAAMFWIDRLELNTTDGTYECPDEYSPEHGPGAENATAHSQQLVWELFDNTLKAVEILGESKVNADDLATLRERFEKLDKGLAIEQYTPNGESGAWGEGAIAYGSDLLREWKTSNYYAGANGHRHMSHLMCLYPFNQITAGTDLFNAAINSMKLRGDASTGWSMGWKINLWARALDGDHSHDILELALRHHSVSGGGVYYNLYDSHSPFQIDGNFGACAGIAEMLMQSHTDVLDILPALPSVWQKGAIKGLKAVGNFTVDIEWENSLAQKVTIVSHKGAPLRVRSNHGAMDIAKAKIAVNGVEVNATVENGIATIPCAQGQTVVVDFTTEKTIVEYVVSGGTGKFNGTWAHTWTYTKSEDYPADLKLITTNGAGNMQGANNEMHLYSGQSQSSPYRLQVSLPYKITGYSFDYQDKGNNQNKTITIGEDRYNVTTDVQTIKIVGLDTHTADFTLAGANQKVLVTNFKVLIKKVQVVEFTYKYTYNGLEKAETMLAEVGRSYPIPSAPFGLTTNTTMEGVVKADDDGQTFVFECESNTPFEYADSYENITKWYYMQMHSNNKKYIEYIPNGNYLEWADGSLPTTGPTSAHIWAFVGNPINGFKLYNRSAGAKVSVKSTGDGNPTMAADGTAFLLAASSVTGNNYFCLQYPVAGGKYLNAQGDKVAHWGVNDAGSTILLTEAVIDGYYIFRNAEQYLSDDRKSDDSTQRILTSEKSAKNIFYYDGYTLIGYSSGYGFEYGICNTKTAGAWNSFTFEKNNTTGEYYVKSGAGTSTVGDADGYWKNNNNELERVSKDNASLWTLTAVKELPVTISSVGYATFIAPVALQIPEGVKAYTGVVNDNWLTLKAVEDGVIPANTGVVLESQFAKGEDKVAKTFNFTIVADDVEAITSDLKGSVAAKANDKINEVEIPYYTLQKPGDEVVFMQYNGDVLAGSKAYLDFTANPTSAQSISIRFEGTTDIEHAEIRNQHSEIIFDLFGRRVEAITKGGIYIVNGKKVVIK